MLGVALRDGVVVTLNGLTGHEQHRVIADWRTPEQQKAGSPSNPYMQEAAFSRDARTLVATYMEWVYVWDVKSGAMRRKIQHARGVGWRLALAPDGQTLATSDVPLDQSESWR